MIQFARQRAAEDKAPELEEWALRLERAWAEPLDQARQSFMDAAARTVSLRVGPASAPPGPAPAPVADPTAAKPGAPPPPGTPPGGSRYIGGLR
jgi:hypothetical protein